ncbi:glycosyltransferase family 4 protein [Leptolyngbya sp. AN02str]|uniref:glycosyltransferase family 4 protein n=1 Tax=Leptolyngbya sp. AN02str TaxID=3423363 RepID=UPI003D313FC2
MGLRIALLHFCFTEYTVGLANGLANHADVTVIQPDRIAADCGDRFDPRVKVLRFTKPRIRDLRNLGAMRAMLRLVREVNPNVLHVQETNDYWYDLTLLLNRMPPLVTTIHDVFRHPGDRDNVVGSEYTRRIAFYRSQRLIVHAQCLKDALVQQFRLPESRVGVVPHGELGFFFRRSPTPTVARDPATVLFFGRIWPYKGLQYLVNAIPLVAEQVPEVQLVIAGRGQPAELYLVNQSERSRFQVLNEFIPHEQVAQLFERSTITVLPYVESSQSGVAAIAFALGSPVIASNIGGLSELIHSEQDGVLVPPRDTAALATAITRLLHDRPLQERLRTNAQIRCQTDLNWDTIAQLTIPIYEEAMAEYHKS